MRVETTEDGLIEVWTDSGDLVVSMTAEQWAATAHDIKAGKADDV